MDSVSQVLIESRELPVGDLGVRFEVWMSDVSVNHSEPIANQPERRRRREKALGLGRVCGSKLPDQQKIKEQSHTGVTEMQTCYPGKLTG